MALNNDLIMRFVRATKSSTSAKDETTVYGTIKESDGVKYVQFDGSEIYTPVVATSDAKHGDRVTVMIKNHTATVTGNLSSPSARLTEVESLAGNVNEIKVGKLDAKTAQMTYATIESLKATDAKVENFDATYANIDFSNIGEAAIEYLYAQSGLIKNVTVSNGTITGELVGVTIRGDRLIGGTVIADKLVIKGSDGLFYKLNTDGMKVEAEQTSQNSLNGSVILAKSITATKISVDDLVAFDATIGGFNITANSLYSGVKSSVGNITRGIYFDKDGQLAIGDSSNYLKYYKDTDGSYKLAISAKSLMMSGGSDVGTAIENLQNGINGLEVGGRNLALDSASKPSGSGKTTRYWSGYGTWTYVENYKDHFCAARATSQWSGISVYLNPLLDSIHADDTFTFSTTVYNNANVDIGISYYLMQFTSGGERVYLLTANSHDLAVIHPSETRRLSVTCKVNQALIDHMKNDGSARMTIQTTNATTNDVYFYAPKLEKGNKPTDWTPAPEDVDKATSTAAKTATNYLQYDSSSGLQIGNKTSGSWSGFRTQITSTAFNILNSAGTVLASYGEKLIELGKNATDAVIKLCGGKGRIEYVADEDTGVNYLQLVANKLRLRSSEMSSLYSMYTNNSTRWEKSAVNISPTKVEMYASKCIDPTLVEKVEGWNTTEFTLNPDSVDLNTPGTISITDKNGSIQSFTEGTSGIWTYRKWANGVVELWGSYAVSNLACTTALGGMYRTAVFTPNSFPFTVYSPNVVASYESEGYGAFLWATTNTTTSKPPNYYLVRPTSTTIASGKINFHVRGRWKT